MRKGGSTGEKKAPVRKNNGGPGERIMSDGDDNRKMMNTADSVHMPAHGSMPSTTPQHRRKGMHNKYI